MRVMSEKLLSLIKQNKTVNEISSELNLSNKQIYNILRLIVSKGFDFDREYYDNGDIIYSPKNPLIQDKQDNKNATIITQPGKNDFRAIVISDLHIGNSLQRLDSIKRVYDYCAKEGIHNIFICGDLIDGTYGQSEKIIEEPEKQIDFFIKNYPFDKSILNYAILGDHDFSSLYYCSQNLAGVLYNYRHDIVPIGYQLGHINIKNEKIILMHKFSNKFKKCNSNLTKITDFRKKLILQGHYHSEFSVESIKTNYVALIPSLSDIRDMSKEKCPVAIKLQIVFHKNVFSSLEFTPLLIGDTVIPKEEDKAYVKWNSPGRRHF